MALAGPSFPWSARTHKVSNHRTPTATCAPWVPVSTKNVQPNRLVLIVRPLWTNSVNSITCPPRNTRPSRAVENSQIFPHFMSPRCTAASASTIMRLDISKSRSEEHTSELQSQSNLVCRLLLEKKKNKQDNTDHPQTHSDR